MLSNFFVFVNSARLFSSVPQRPDEPNTESPERLKKIAILVDKIVGD